MRAWIDYLGHIIRHSVRTRPQGGGGGALTLTHFLISFSSFYVFYVSSLFYFFWVPWVDSILGYMGSRDHLLSFVFWCVANKLTYLLTYP